MLSGNHIAGFFKMKYRKKEAKDGIYFSHADKYESLLQVDIIIFQACPKYPKQQYLKKHVSDEVDFLNADIKACCKLIL